MNVTGNIVTAAPAPPLSRSIGSLLLISIAILVGFTMLQSFGIMAESAKAELGLSDTALGAVQGVSAAIPLVLFSIPIGIWIDRRSRVPILLVMGIGWTLGTFVTAAAPNILVLFLGRMLTSIGTTGGLTAVLSLSADYCRPEQRGRALLVPNIFKIAGIAAGFAVAGLLLGEISAHHITALVRASAWRNALWMLGIGSAVLLLPLLLLREPERHEVEAGPSAPIRIVFAEVRARRSWLIPLFIGQTGVVMADAAAGIWISPVLQRSYHLQPAQFAGWLGALVLITGILGTLIGGFAADLGQKSAGRGGLVVGAVAAAIVGVPSALFPVMPDVIEVAAAIGMLMLAGSVTGLVASVALTVWLPNELRGLCIGAFIAVAGLIGFGLAPTLVTMVSALLGGEQHLSQALAIVGVLVSLLSVAGFAFCMRHAPQANSIDHSW